MTRILPHIHARLSEPLTILSAKLEEIGAVLAALAGANVQPNMFPT